MASFLSKSKCHEEETRGFVIISCKEMKITSIQKKPTLLWTQLGFGCFVDKICIQERQTVSNCGTKPLPHNGIKFEMTLMIQWGKDLLHDSDDERRGWVKRAREGFVRSNAIISSFSHYLQSAPKSTDKEIWDERIKTQYQSLETKNNWLTLVAPKEFVFKRSSAHTTILLRLMNWPTQ